MAGSTAARRFAEMEGLSHEALTKLCIIVEELLSNVYEHGGVAEHEEVYLTFAGEPGGVRMTLIDPGRPFDPRGTAPQRKAQEGGAGIAIIRAWAEIADYRSTDAGNRLELILPFRT